MTDEEASDIIENALNKATLSDPEHENGDLIVDWVAVVYVSNPDPDKESGYMMFVPNGKVPPHRAIGLLYKGLDYIEEEKFV